MRMKEFVAAVGLPEKVSCPSRELGGSYGYCGYGFHVSHDRRCEPLRANGNL